MPRKAGTGCPLPEFLERQLVGSHSLLFNPLRSCLRTGAARSQRTSLARPPGWPQSAKLIAFQTENRSSLAGVDKILKGAKPAATSLLMEVRNRSPLGLSNCCLVFPRYQTFKSV